MMTIIIIIVIIIIIYIIIIYIIISRSRSSNNHHHFILVNLSFVRTAHDPAFHSWRAESVWPEVALLHLQTDQSSWPLLTNGKLPLVSGLSQAQLLH